MKSQATIFIMELRHQNLTRYITPLREGGSLPAMVEADDGFTYALKFKGGGHGPKALISELVGGELARALGLRVPELVFLSVDPLFGITEPDEEVQDLIKASLGTNIGLHFLKKSMTFDPYTHPIGQQESSLIVWLDAFIMNVDRTHRNTNMLSWYGETWLIDHGASLYFHHNWHDREKAVDNKFIYIKDHVLLHKATRLEDADDIARQKITPGLIREIIDLIPDEWLQWQGVNDSNPQELRAEYTRILTQRLANSQIFVKHATDTRNGLV